MIMAARTALGRGSNNGAKHVRTRRIIPDEITLVI